MTDLRYVHVDDTLYVTSKENAAAMEERLKKESKSSGNENADKSDLPSTRYRKGSGRPGIAPAGLPGGLL
jgi:hypothetical protein